MYDIDQSSDVIYFLKQGSVMMESVVEIDNKNRHPTGKNSWELKTTKLSIGF